MGPDEDCLALADALLAEYSVASKINGVSIERYTLAYSIQAFIESQPQGEVI